MIVFCALLPQTPAMTLGSHRLKGTIVRLKEPFCLMQKQYEDDDNDDDDDDNTKNENNNTTRRRRKQQQLKSYQIIGIVREKYLFASYPKVIMRPQQQQQQK